FNRFWVAAAAVAGPPVEAYRACLAQWRELVPLPTASRPAPSRSAGRALPRSRRLLPIASTRVPAADIVLRGRPRSIGPLPYAIRSAGNAQEGIPFGGARIRQDNRRAGATAKPRP